MSTATAPAPWWRTAPNPPCVSWCEDVHAPGEFNFGGGFLCRKVIAETADFVVEVQSYVGVDEDATPGVYEAAPAAVWQDVRPSEVLSPEHARAFARSLALAISEAATVAERTVR